MLLQRPFEALTPTLDGDCLAVLAGANSFFTVSQVQRVLDGERSLSGLRRALDRLAEHGVVRSERFGPAYAYALNREHLLAEAIIEVASAKTRLIDRVRDRVQSWEFPPVYAALFGSAARGDMRTGSDIDLFLVRPESADWERWTDAVHRLQADMISWTGNDTRVLEFSEQEAAEHGSTDQVVASVTRDGITLAGRPNWNVSKADGR